MALTEQSRVRFFRTLSDKSIVDTGWDLVQYDGFGEGFEPGNDNFEQRGDAKNGDRCYTGICWLEPDDPVASQLSKMSGRGAFSTGS